jgi:hypothetical protein
MSNNSIFVFIRNWKLHCGFGILFCAITGMISGHSAELKFRVQQLHQDNNEGCAIGDINKDGKLDVVAGEFWYAAPDFDQHPLRKLAPFGKDYLQDNGDHLYDVNRDGWLDVVAGGFTITEVHWYENPGKQGMDGLWKKHLLVDTKTEQNEMTYLHDLDGNGTPEYFENSWNDGNPMLAWRFVWKDGGAVSLVRHTIGPKINGHGMGFGDINGDGHDDILFKQGWYECPSEGAFTSAWKYHDDFTFPHGSCPILVTDLDEDGRNDIIWADGHNYGLYWERQQKPTVSGDTRWRQYLIDKSFSQAHALAWEDIDNDGAPELITGKRYYAHSGGDPGANDPVTVQYYDWDKATLTFSKRMVSQGKPGEGPGIGLQIRVVDLDGNGWKDIVTPGKSGTHILWNLGE